ncbi:MAG: hypothetical protein GXO62_00925 [Epsilonproteobacteria bacterium]|nr:hypothetical protein [Campylobacterota bacterium]
MKKLKLITISSKGGVGKSAISMQILAPYLYEKNNKEPINYYEFDNENVDLLSYGDSQLTKREQIEIEEFIVADKLIEVFSQDAHSVIDIGGNKSASMILEAIETSGIGELIDLAVIPMLDGEQDAINAKKVYDQLKAANPNMNIVFALNRVINPKYVEYQFENFFGDVRGIFKNIFYLQSYIDKKDNYITIDNSDLIKFSRRFGITIYEIANAQRDFTSQIKNHKDINEAKLLMFKNYIYQNSKRYYESTIKKCFGKFEEILNG